MHSRLRAMTLLGVVSLPLLALAHASADATITPIFAHAILNIPGKSLKALVGLFLPPLLYAWLKRNLRAAV